MFYVDYRSIAEKRWGYYEET